MGGSLKSVLFANIDQILNKHKKQKKKSQLQEDDVEIIEAFKSNLQAQSHEVYQTRILDLEKAVA